MSNLLYTCTANSMQQRQMNPNFQASGYEPDTVVLFIQCWTSKLAICESFSETAIDNRKNSEKSYLNIEFDSKCCTTAVSWGLI